MIESTELVMTLTDPSGWGWLGALLTLTPVLWGVVSTTGSVIPVGPAGMLPIGQEGIDEDANEVVDWIGPAGNTVRVDWMDQDNVSGSGTKDGSGLMAWLDPRPWLGYDSNWPVEVGHGGYGHLSVNGGSALRPRDLTLGRGGRGILTVTGFGSSCNTALERIPYDLRSIIAFAQAGASDSSDAGPGGSTPHQVGDVSYTDIPELLGASGTLYPNIPTAIGPSRRWDGTGDPPNFDHLIGHTYSSEVNLLAGGRDEVQNRLIVQKRSRYTIDGFGSHLYLGHSAAATALAADPEAAIGSSLQSHIEDESFLQITNGGAMSIDNAPLRVDGTLEIRGPGATIHGDLQIEGRVTINCNGSLAVNGNITGSGDIIIANGGHLLNESVSPTVYLAKGRPAAIQGSGFEPLGDFETA